jgi:hypothetical protein
MRSKNQRSITCENAAADPEKGNETRPCRESVPVINESAARAPSLADVLRVEEHDDATLVTLRAIDRPLLHAWPAGYQNGGFRVVDGGALLSTKGMPTLFLREAEKLAAAAE